MLGEYKNTCAEINELYFSFSRLTKTLNIASTALLSGDDKMALLHYHDVAQIYKEQKNRPKLGTCYNNIGCIELRMGQVEKEEDYFKEAITL